MTCIPIRPGVEARTDPARDLASFAVENITAFAECDEPVSVALVVFGKHRAGAISWSLDPEKAIGDVCGHAAALLLNRAAQQAE